MAILLIDQEASGSTDAPATWGTVGSMTATVTPQGTGSVLLLMAHVPLDHSGTENEAADFRFSVGGSPAGSPIGRGFRDGLDEANDLHLFWAVDGQSGSTTFTLEWQQTSGVAQTHATRNRTFQIVELDADASLLVDTSATSTDADPATWTNMPSLSATVTPASGSLLLFIMSGMIPLNVADAASEFRFALGGARDGPQTINMTDSTSAGNQVGSAMIWAETGHSATSQVLSLQWQELFTGASLDADNRIFQVVEVTANFSLGVDVLVSSADDVAVTDWDLMPSMTGTHTADSTDSIILLLAASSFQGINLPDEMAAMAFADDGTREGAEPAGYKDGIDVWGPWGLSHAKTAADTSSHTYTLRALRIQNTATTSADPRSFQVIEFSIAAAAVYPPFPRRQLTTVRM